MVESTLDLRLDNHIKEIHFFDEESITESEKKTTENKDGDAKSHNKCPKNA